MSVIAVEGFDHLSVAQILLKQGRSGSITSVQTARLAGQAMRLSAQNENGLLLSGWAATTSIVVGHALKMAAPIVSTQRRSLLRAGGAAVVGLTTVLVGSDICWRIVGSAGATLATGTTPIVAGAWVYLELACTVNASTGTVELRLNGASTAECSATGLNTGSAGIDAVEMSGTSTGSNTHDCDDLYIVDRNSGSAPTNTFLGDVRVETLTPNGNGANTAWTGVYTDIDDSTSHDSDTTYINSATPGDRETATLSDLAVGTGTIFAVQTNVVARKDDAGSRTIAPVLRIGGVNYDGTTTAALSTDYRDYTQLYDRLDPVGNAWTIANVNAMEAGVKEVG